MWRKDKMDSRAERRAEKDAKKDMRTEGHTYNKVTYGQHIVHECTCGHTKQTCRC